jgi:hypothetical protein
VGVWAVGVAMAAAAAEVVRGWEALGIGVGGTYCRVVV